MKMFKKSITIISAVAMLSGLCISANAAQPAPQQAAASENNLTDGVKATTYAELNCAVTSGEKKIYILNDIFAEDGIVLTGNQELIGVPDAVTGELPVLNFENMKGVTDIVNATSSDSDIGIRIKTSNNKVANLVVEKAHDNGIQIKGNNATGNTIENCIVRYNNDSGIQIAGGAKGNTLKNVYSYRNCDVYTLGSNADGFAIKLGAGPAATTDEKAIEDGKITLVNCFSWENGDDGWDSYDKESDYWTYRIDYTDCMAWNNGTPENCLGYTDYINGAKLDENLPIMMRFKKVNRKQYNKFVTLYNKGGVCSRNASPKTYYERLDALLGKIPTKEGSLNASGIVENWAGNPNGFKLGSKFTQQISERRMENCISFDHTSKGFDNNNSFAKIWAKNCISFNNGKNYKLSHESKTYTAYKWDNICGWNGNDPDELPLVSENCEIKTTSAEKSETAIRLAAKNIFSTVNTDKIPNVTIFNEVFTEN